MNIITEPEPILVSQPKARRLIDCGETKFAQLVQAGLIKLVDLGEGRARMVDFASLRALADRRAAD
jgi:hypothetical protein